jgi:hypothetical protein
MTYGTAVGGGVASPFGLNKPMVYPWSTIVDSGPTFGFVPAATTCAKASRQLAEGDI